MLLPQIYPDIIECGTDEAGRGCLAGPVTAAAVILPQDFKCAALNDSKKLSRKRRNQLRTIIEKEAIAYHVAHVDMRVIEQINILNASIQAMHEAVKGLKIEPQHIAVDGNRFKAYPGINHTTVIKGDGKYLHIAAASILAKTHRDALMQQLDQEFPQYDWCNNQGYPTMRHRQAIRDHGTTDYHRMTFKLLPEQLELPL
ncbi:ribonuclease HII [Nonlabens ponticola]|uniref:Ribonuclease HII n=1 Tax=Nonlabens ponticola TaxID=2496866 RepID=A0A3S9MXA9_9FLAO|nr:ribonuclease HII [Nonlabens ponticola]AZQ43830.1 ribonuclease HII [Nonlabens ponticola]